LTFSITSGYSHGFYSGDPLKLLEDIVELKPTFFVTVPRILNRVYGKIMDGVNQKGGVAKWLFNKAVTDKTYYLMNGQGLSHKLYDKTVFQKVKDLFGGNLKFMITASAPINGEVLTFFKIALGIHVYEVYGQTESNGPITVTHPLDPTAGHVGGMISTCAVRLKDVPEMGYLSTDNPPRGEIQFKGHNTFRGYFKNPEKTSEAISEDGWTSTGDVAIVFPNGSIKIVDRAKNIFKLCQGEYIAPEKLENAYQQCPLVAQIFVYGDSLQAYLLGFIVPDPENAKKWFADKGLEAKFDNEDFKKAIIAQLDAKAKEFSFTSLEKIKKIHLHPQPFSVDNNLLTPTFKIKRNDAKKFFKEQIDAMYAEPI
jgi:long-chain acyl-CoA synthetase